MGTSSIDGGLKFDGKQSDLKHNINITFFKTHTPTHTYIYIYTWNIIYKINGF